jgi:mono/diheme cytochrome c family protein
MPVLQRAFVVVLATLPVWTACKISERFGKGSDSKTDGPETAEPQPSAPELADHPYVVHVRIALEGQPLVTTLQDLKPFFVNQCLGCHGAGSVLDMSEYPFKGRFATPEATYDEILRRIKGEGAPMPPLPQAPVTDEQIAALEKWRKEGFQITQPPREAPVFAQGLILTVFYRPAGTKTWTEASLPWNGSGDFPGFFRQVPAGQALDVQIVASAEDRQILATQSFQALTMPPSGNVEFSIAVNEADLKRHAVDREPAVPGGDGKIVARDVAERSVKIHWEPASDLLTDPGNLLYAVYVSDGPTFTSVEEILETGRQVSEFSAYQELLQITGLAQGKTYYFAVLVKDRGGNVSLYDVLEQATAADKTPPTVAVDKVTATALSDVSVTLNWQAATDDLSPPERISYQVFAGFKDEQGDAASEPLPNRTSLTLRGLVPETTYFFDVVAIDEAGNRTPYKRLQVKSRAGSGSIGILSYGRQCAERLGELKPFNCLDGQIIPIVIDGKEISRGLTAQQAQAFKWGTGANQMKCDKPALLGLGEQGRCVPYSRVGRLKSYRPDGSEHPDVDTVFTCRRYVTRLGPQTYQGKTYDGADLPLYEDIAVIQHNRVTGETCWFQMLKPGYASADGRRVPPPTEQTLPADAPAHAQAATQFWIAPQATADKKCFRCHDADPWMHSPYIDQVRDDAGNPIVPPGGFGGGRSGKYSMLGSRAFYKWDKSFAVASTVTSDTNGKSCTSCHNIGSFNGCETWAKQASGQLLAANLSPAGQAFHLRYWMPPSEEKVTSFAEWQASGFKRAAERLAACCANPNQAGCSKTPIMTPPPPFAAP